MIKRYAFLIRFLLIVVFSVIGSSSVLAIINNGQLQNSNSNSNDSLSGSKNPFLVVPDQSCKKQICLDTNGDTLNGVHVVAGASVTVQVGGDCRVITAGNKDLFIPTHSSIEWSSFVNYAQRNNMAACCPGYNGNSCMANDCSAQNVNLGGLSVSLPSTVNGAPASGACPTGYTGSPQYSCNLGAFTYVSGSCVVNNCGALPVNAIACTGTPAPGVNGASYTLVGACNGTACSAVCKSGYALSSDGLSCVRACTPTIACSSSLNCGTDSCGNVCGTCSGGQSCSSSASGVPGSCTVACPSPCTNAGGNCYLQTPGTGYYSCPSGTTYIGQDDTGTAECAAVCPFTPTTVQNCPSPCSYTGGNCYLQTPGSGYYSCHPGTSYIGQDDTGTAICAAVCPYRPTTAQNCPSPCSYTGGNCYLQTPGSGYYSCPSGTTYIGQDDTGTAECAAVCPFTPTTAQNCPTPCSYTGGNCYLQTPGTGYYSCPSGTSYLGQDDTGTAKCAAICPYTPVSNNPPSNNSSPCSPKTDTNGNVICSAVAPICGSSSNYGTDSCNNPCSVKGPGTPCEGDIKCLSRCGNAGPCTASSTFQNGSWGASVSTGSTGGCCNNGCPNPSYPRCDSSGGGNCYDASGTTFIAG